MQDENKDAEYLCLSYNPFADVIAVGLDNGHIKLIDEKTLKVGQRQYLTKSADYILPILN